MKDDAFDQFMTKMREENPAHADMVMTLGIVNDFMMASNRIMQYPGHPIMQLNNEFCEIVCSMAASHLVKIHPDYDPAADGPAALADLRKANDMIGHETVIDDMYVSDRQKPGESFTPMGKGGDA